MRTIFDKHKATLRGFILFSLTFLLPLQASAIAYCAIREPVQSIQQFFPDFTSYKTLDGEISDTVRVSVQQKLSEKTFNEAGRHNLYVVFGSDGVAGFVHARTEKGLYGLDEIIWSIYPNLSIKGFAYQRQRGTRMNAAQLEHYKTLVSGQTAESLEELLDENKLTVPEIKLFESALKALLVTQGIWGGEISEL